MRPVFLILAAACLLTILPARGQSLQLRVPFIPTPVKIMDSLTLYYELYLTNHSANAIQLDTLTILDAKNKTVFRRRLPTTNLLPNDSTIAYIELTLPPDPLVTALTHRIDYRPVNNNKSGESITLVLPPPTNISLGNPLRQGPWCAVYQPSWETGHRRKRYTRDGITRIPGRFAIDFIRLDQQGKYASGNSDSITSWLGYGADVLAVADGNIVAALDTFPESPTLSGHPKWPAEKATGNYICLQIGSNEFVFYEHLKPGSIKVTAGQPVRKGEVIAALGFTGQSTGPHLHLHMANSPSPLGSEGIPFVFGNFMLLGSYDNFGDFGRSRWSPLPDHYRPERKQERPPPNAVIVFQ